MKLHFAINNKLENLAQDLMQILKNRPKGAKPFAKEAIVVMNPGNGTWLNHELARQLGVCANIDFITRGGFWNRVIPDMKEASSRYNPQTMTWRIFSLLQSTQSPELQAYCESNAQLPRARYELASEIANAFDVYQVYRTDTLARWIISDTPEANPHAEWQRTLWQSLHAATGGTSPAELFLDFLNSTHLSEYQNPIDSAFPLKRVCVFGIGAMPPLQVSLFEKLSQIIDVYFFHLNPSCDFWGDNLHPKKARWIEKHTHVHTEALGSPLLSVLGESGRALFNTLIDNEDYLNTEPQWEIPYDDFSPSPSLLSAVQNSIFENLEQIDFSPATAVGDDSLVIHICHNEIREMEVLRDDILRKLDANIDSDARLEPHDIIVMAPNISKYVPAINAVFGRWNEDHPGQKIPYSITDRTHAEESQFAEAFTKLLSFGKSRMKFSEFYELISYHAIWDCLALPSDSLREIILDHLYNSGIRWGWNANDHAQHAAHFEDYTWVKGLRAHALAYARGVSLAGERDGNEINDATAVALGAIAELAERVHSLGAQLSVPHTPSEWGVILNAIVDTFLLSNAQTITDLQTIRKSIDALVSSCDEANASKLGLPCEIISAFLDTSLWSVANTGGFLSHGITFCRLQPLRNVPSKYVWIAGMNDNEYPRRDKRRSFDLLKINPREGDRSDRNDDCQLLLDAILSARTHLRFSYVGSDSQNNKPVPPGVLLNEIRQELIRAYHITDDDIISGKQMAPFELRHQLHPFAPEYFNSAHPWLSAHTRNLWQNLSHTDFNSAQTLNAYRATRTLNTDAIETVAKKALANQLFPGQTEDCEYLKRTEYSLDELISFWGNPAKEWLNRVLRLYFSDGAKTYSDDEPFAVDGLQKFSIQQRAINLFIAEGVPAGDWFTSPERLVDSCEWAKAQNIMPVGARGEQFIADTLTATAKLGETIQAHYSGWSRIEKPLLVSLPIGDIKLVGLIPDIYEKEGQIRILSARPSKPKLKDAMRLIILACLLQVTKSQCKILADKTVSDSILISKTSVYSHTPRSVDDAQKLLEILARDMTAALGGDPAPLFLIGEKTAITAYEKLIKNEPHEKIIGAANTAYIGTYNGPPSDGQDPYNKLMFGTNLDDEQCQRAIASSKKYLSTLQIIDN